MSDRDKFIRSCDDAPKFPINLFYPNAYNHILVAYSDRLEKEDSRLFFDESKASLTIRDYDENVQAFENITLCSYQDTREYLSDKSLFDRLDPQCRFVFLSAPHSRERLRITRSMLNFLFTYHQVMPAFVDYLFPFGRQHYAQDFYFSGFHHEERLSIDEGGLNIPELGRSGHDIRMCFNLKSVEPSKSQAQWPWSIRHTAVYHSFDIETGKSFWTIVKGDQLIKKRLEVATKLGSSSSASAFSSSLAAHLVIFDWCRENWRWYINYLEEGLQNSSRQALLANVDAAARRNTTASLPVAPPRVSSSQICASPTNMSEKHPFRSFSLLKRPPTYTSQQLSSNLPPAIDPFSQSEESLVDGEEEFKFGDLQHIQNLEEKANEILLVLESNIHILSELKDHYHNITASTEWPEELSQNCARDVARFEKSTAGIINDLQMQKSRANMLLRLLTDRKSLLYGILDFRSMKANQLFAEKAQISTENMESMTHDMHEIAIKTKQETVSMRIITLVTLFFLPGTFISTIMSTDIVQFQLSDSGQSQENFSLGALRLYMAITIPLMVLTFAAWYGVYLWVDKKETAREQQKKLSNRV